MRAPGVEASRFGEDFVVLDGAGKMIRGLNATGARVFELVDGVRSEEEIARQIATEFDADDARAQQDVRAFLEALVHKSLIRFEERPSPEGRGVTP